MTDDEGLIRYAEVVRLTGLAIATIRRLIKEGKFPQPVPLTQSTVAFVRVDVLIWISEAHRRAHSGDAQRRVARDRIARQRAYRIFPHPRPDLFEAQDDIQ